MLSNGQLFSGSSAGYMWRYEKESIFRQNDGNVRVWIDCIKSDNTYVRKPFLYEYSCTGQARELDDQKIGEWTYLKPDQVFYNLEKIVCKPR